MKKILTTLAIAGLTVASFAQGTVNWSASPSVNFIAQTNSTAYSQLSAALGAGQTTAVNSGGVANTPAGQTTLFYYALLYSTSASTTPTTLSTLAGSWSNTGLLMTNGPGANGRINPVNPNAAATVPWAAGTSANVMLVGWSANLGNNYATVLSLLQNWSTQNSTVTGQAFFGESSVGAVTSSSSSITGATVFGGSPLLSNPSANPAQLFLLATVPEPGTLALAAIGGASLLLFRRKK